MGNTPKGKRSKGAVGAGPRGPSAGGGRRSVGAYVVGGVVAVALVLLVVFIAMDVSNNPQTVPDAPAGTEYFTIEDAGHVAGPVDYPTSPPVGGPHSAEPLACGAYPTPVPDERAVHTLEHGAAWLTYEPDVDAATIGALESFARRRDVLVSPYPGQVDPIVLTTWGTQLRLEELDDDVIDQFIRAFQHRTAPENNVGC